MCSTESNLGHFWGSGQRRDSRASFVGLKKTRDYGAITDENVGHRQTAAVSRGTELAFDNDLIARDGYNVNAS